MRGGFQHIRVHLDRRCALSQWRRHSTTSENWLKEWHVSTRCFHLAQALRHRGHLAARLDPLRGKQSRQLSPKEPIHWRIGGSHGQKIPSIDVNRLLRNYPDSVDLSVFALESYAEDDPLPEGVNVPAFWGAAPGGRWTFRSFIDHLCGAYASTLSCEHQHIDNPIERIWLEERLEARVAQADVDQETQREALNRLLRASILESFLGEKFPEAKRFGLKGCEALLPALWALTEKANELGMEHLQLGMAHRGRLNVLVNFTGKRLKDVCSEFDEQNDLIGDLKYHLGTRGTCRNLHVQLTLAPNPSHLEAVDPVVLGMTRAKQDYMGDTDMRRVMGVLIHGDAAFCGQGILSECLQLSDLPAYTTGGTVHFVINNMVGFTTDPRAARSSYHCTNVAKVNDAPILHVNADDVDAVLFVSKLAAEYRQTFRKDVVVDLVCYRREGHSEAEDPSLTQPLSQRRMKEHLPVSQQYSELLVETGVLTQEQVERLRRHIQQEFEAERESQLEGSSFQNRPLRIERPVNLTGLPLSWLKMIGEAACRIPENVNAHKKVRETLEKRKAQLQQGRIDWPLAETLAIGSLILRFNPERHEELKTGLLVDSEGIPELHYRVHPPCHVRLSGQDVERGTFNQRHSIIHDQDSAIPYSMLSDLGLGDQSEAVVCNSSLSELAILGFEYGYSVEEGAGLALTMWEAQFGDFANCAQPIIDNFIASGEQKWGSESNLVMLLPHGLEGQGPEHSSARPERFLQLVDEDPDMLWPASEKELVEEKKHEARQTVHDVLEAIRAKDQSAVERSVHRLALLQENFDACGNLMVVYITTPANLFHVLRRQVHRSFAKPLVVMTGKNILLKHTPCRSPLEDMMSGTRFQRLIQEGGTGDNMNTETAGETDPMTCKRMIFCSGQVFYDLRSARDRRGLKGEVVLHRLEQLAPFPAMSVALVCSQYPHAELCWVQEEPKNMGPWSYVWPRLATALRELTPEGFGVPQDRAWRCIARPAAASPATPLWKMHKQEKKQLIDLALNLNS